jgi:CubicO group peptidase (beta-lactamase class C family)
VLLARIWMDRLGEATAALAFPRTALFGPLGMASAVMEADARGTLVGGSYIYATAHDWARIGQFLLDDGVWAGTRLVPEGFVKLMTTSNGLPGGYSQLQSWVQGPHESEDGKPVGLPEGTFWLEGHDGQTVAIVPSVRLVVVRLGLTPWKLDYWPETLVKAVVAAAP